MKFINLSCECFQLRLFVPFCRTCVFVAGEYLDKPDVMFFFQEICNYTHPDCLGIQVFFRK